MSTSQYVLIDNKLNISAYHTLSAPLETYQTHAISLQQFSEEQKVQAAEAKVIFLNIS